MYEAVEKVELHVRKVSFKCSLQTIRSRSPQLNRALLSRAEAGKLLNDWFKAAVTSHPLKQRPGRSEPRCRKRQPKTYQPFSKPRHEK